MSAGMRTIAFLAILLIAYVHIAPGDLIDATLLVAGALMIVLLVDGLVSVWRSPRRGFLLAWGRRVIAFALTTTVVAAYLVPLDSPLLIGLPFALGLIATLLLELRVPSRHRPTVDG